MKSRNDLIWNAQKINNLKSKYGAGTERVETSAYIRIGEVKFPETPKIALDTYCNVFADRVQKGRTPTIEAETPVFNEEFEFNIEDDTQTILVQLKDQRKKKNNVIGQVIIPTATLADQTLVEGWQKMMPGESNVILSGKLRLQVYFVDNQVKVNVIEGLDLAPMDSGGSADPYVVVSYGSGQYKTPTQVKTLNPRWKEQVASFDLLDESTPIIVEVFDAHKDGSFDFMGEIVLPLAVIREANGQTKWYELKDKQRVAEGQPIGQMRIAIQIREAVILPDKLYDDLFAILMSDEMAVVKKLAAVSVNKEKPVAEALVKAFEMRRSAVHYIKTITSNEIDSTSDANIIFRGNTVATKSVDMYMRLVGLPYLHYILKSIVEEIFENGLTRRKSCELDPTRITEEPNEKKKALIIKKNLKTLLGYADQIFTAVRTSFNVCPATFRNMCEYIQSNVRRKFGDEAISRYTCVSGFIFLRFFCPALLTPKNFGLLDEHPPSNTVRDLTLIAKVLQNLANLVPFGKKEPYMNACNDYITENLGSMKAFIDKLSTIPTEPIDEIPSKRSTMNWGREMARVHFHLSEAHDIMREKFGKDALFSKLGDTLAVLDEEAVKIGGQARKRHHYNRASILNDSATRSASSSLSGRPAAASVSQKSSPSIGIITGSPENGSKTSSKTPPPGASNPTDTCASCGRELDATESSVLSMGRRWHEACFKCSECGTPIRGPFVNNNGVPRCLSCQPKMKQCAKCGKDINGNFLHIASKAYHQECFTCHLCSNVMGTSEIFGYVDPSEPEVSFAICPDCNAKINKGIPVKSSSTKK